MKFIVIIACLAWTDFGRALAVAADWVDQFEQQSEGLVFNLPLDKTARPRVEDRASKIPVELHGIRWEEMKVAGEGGFQADDQSYAQRHSIAIFDGSGAYAQLAGDGDKDNGGRLDLVNGFTVGAWIVPQSTMPRRIEEQGYIVSDSAGNRAGFLLTTYYNHGLAANLVTTEGTFHVEASDVLRDGARQLVAMTWDGQFLQLHVDGKAVGSATPTRGKLKLHAGPLCIGKAADRDGQYFTGGIEHVRIFNRALQAARFDAVGQAIVRPAENHDPAEKPQPRSRFLDGIDREHRTPLVDFEDLSNWEVVSFNHVSEAAMYRSRSQPLWGQYAAKLVFRSGPVNDSDRKFVIRPAKPIPVDHVFDAINLWVFGNYWGKSSGLQIAVDIEDAAGKKHSFPLATREHPFVFWTGWYIFHRALPEPIAPSSKLVSLTFSGFSPDQEHGVFIDSLDLYSIDRSPIEAAVPTWQELDLPNTPDGMLPALGREIRYSNSVEKSDDSVRLIYAGQDERVEYLYKPKTGTLSDITAIHGNKKFAPAESGGLVLEVAGLPFALDAKGVVRKLESLSVEGNVVRTRWNWGIGGLTFPVYIDLSIRQKSLIVDLRADADYVSEVRLGHARGLASPKLMQVPYWVLRPGLHESADPSVLYSDGTFVTAFLDHYKSEASELFGESRLLDENSAIYNGGSAYYRRTDGKRNAPAERIYITVSSTFDQTLPSIPHKANRWLDVTKKQVWATRMWYVNEMPYPTYYDEESAFWDQVRQYGIEHLNIRQHGSLYRQYVHNNGEPISMVTSSDPGLGGDEKLKGHIRHLQRDLGYNFGFYTNYTLIDPLHYAAWDENFLALGPDGQWRYGTANHAMVKPSCILPLQAKFNAILKEKFDPTLSYPDQFTCRPLWDFTDFDARVPEAGKFAPVLRIFAQSMLGESAQFGGPVLSEGIMHWTLAGLVDSYAQPGDPEQRTLVDFQLNTTVAL